MTEVIQEGKREFDPRNLTRQQGIEHLKAKYPNAHITSQTRVAQNTGRMMECVYVDGSLALKDKSDGFYKLCNQFADVE